MVEYFSNPKSLNKKCLAISDVTFLYVQEAQSTQRDNISRAQSPVLILVQVGANCREVLLVKHNANYTGVCKNQAGENPCVTRMEATASISVSPTPDLSAGVSMTMG